ncbi:MAG: hypothetical protein ACOVMP_08280 [Chthoniobacterales bacterium]
MTRILPQLLLLSAATFLTACQSNQKAFDPGVPLTLQSVGPVCAEYALDVADTDDNKDISLVEWTSAGGTKRSFELLDENRDGVVKRSELVRLGSNAKFLDFTRRYVDANKDSRLTPQEFRSPAGIRLLRLDF